MGIKYTYISIWCLASVSAQEIKTELPTILPPSPTVAALMKFEDVPVSNYTGIPDISIPIFALPTRAKDIGIDISLKYHPAGIAANERASDVGLGWSLFAGGSISRTVRGLPDEELQFSNLKAGIFHSLHNHYNDYNGHWYDLFSLDPDQGNEYYWDTAEKGKFDTEHDLWQFNFMGQSGSFFIKRDSTGLKVEALDDYRLKIVNQYHPDTFVPTGFSIFDSKGYKFDFTVIEVTVNGTSVEQEFNSTSTTSISADKEFRSAFHLTNVVSPAGDTLVSFIFDNEKIIIESTKQSSSTVNDYYASQFSSNDISTYLPGYNCFGEFAPTKRTVHQLSAVTTKKIKQIAVSGIGKVNFEYAVGRLDTNLERNSAAGYLDAVTITDWNNHFVRKYKFGYDYKTALKKRMVLAEMRELDSIDNANTAYRFFYKDYQATGNVLRKDIWGYINVFPDDTNAKPGMTSGQSATDILQKIQYPTGGCTIFDFEANRYSFVGDEELTDFDNNPDNFHETTYLPVPGIFDSTVTYFDIDDVSVERNAKFYPDIPFQSGIDDKFVLLKKVGGFWDNVGALSCAPADTGCNFDLTLEANTDYRILRSYMGSGTAPNATIEIRYFEKNSVLKKYRYGGGNRIKKMGFFDADVAENYYEDTDMQLAIKPAKQKEFNYTWPGDALKSSGALPFLEPIFQYENKVKLNTTFCPSESTSNELTRTFYFLTSTDFNNLSSLRTSGADVGYKYINVSDSQNGTILYEYTSPLDHPEEISHVNFGLPFMPVKNLDYMRGLLIKETLKDSENKILRITDLEYDEFIEYEKKYGERFYKPVGECFNGNFYNNYTDYIAHCENPGIAYQLIPVNTGNRFSTFGLCGYPVNYILHLDLITVYGWARLKKKVIKGYFYDGSTERIVQNTETFAYNAVNKQLSEHTTTDSNGTILKTEYYYHTGDSDVSQNRISEIEQIKTYSGSTLLSNSKILYTNTHGANHPWLPQYMQSAKGSQALENEIVFTQYDALGNPEIVQQAFGNIIYYVWGYNHSKPVLKIESPVAITLPSTKINQIKETSSSTNNVEDLLAKFEQVRNLLPNAMITGYTYIPLVGVRSITDPKGMTIHYEYDAFGRLKHVRNNEGKMLSEHEYHYATQD